MFLYSVLRWGNEISEEGPDGYDTEFLVKSANVEDASIIVDQAIKEKKLFGNGAQEYCHSIVEIGISHSLATTSQLLYGPIVSELSVFSDDAIPNDKKWVRDSLEEGWVSYVDYYGE